MVVKSFAHISLKPWFLSVKHMLNEVCWQAQELAKRVPKIAKTTFETPCDLPFIWNSGGTSMAERAILCCHCQIISGIGNNCRMFFLVKTAAVKKHANPKSKWAKHDWLDANALDLWLDQNWNTSIHQYATEIWPFYTFLAVHRIKDMNEVQVQVERIPSRKGGGPFGPVVWSIWPVQCPNTQPASQWLPRLPYSYTAWQTHPQQKLSSSKNMPFILR